MPAAVAPFIESVRHPGFRRYFANTSWLGAEQTLRLLVGLLVGVWVARFLGPERFGTLSYVLALYGLASSMATLGLDNIVVRELVQAPNRRDACLGTAFWLKLSAAALSLIVLVGSIGFVHERETAYGYVVLVGTGMLFQSFDVIAFFFQARVQAKFVSLCRIAQLSLSSLLRLGLILAHADLFWFVLTVLLDQVSLGLALLLAYRSQGLGSFFGRFDRQLAQRLMAASWPLMFSGLAVMVYMRIDQLMIKAMLGTEALGLYSAAVRLSEVWYFVPVIITTSVFPAIVAARARDQRMYEERLGRLYTFMIWMAIAAALPMSVLSGTIMRWLYGSSYASGAPALAILSWAGLFVALGVASGKWYLSENRQLRLAMNTAVGALANILLNLLLLPRIGINGAAVATVLSYAIAGYVMNLVSRSTWENFRRMTVAPFRLPRLA